MFQLGQILCLVLLFTFWLPSSTIAQFDDEIIIPKNLVPYVGLDKLTKMNNRGKELMKGIKTASKYGGPTETLELLIASIKIGYNVPSKTVAAEEAKIILLITKAPSLLKG